MDADRERQLVDSLRQGDTTAFDELYEAYRSKLFSFLLRMTRRRAVAEELLQETWLRLAKHAHRLRPDTNIGAWLFTVARNLARGHRRWVLLDPNHWLDLRTSGPEDSPFENAAANQTIIALEVALAALPDKYREVLLLTAVHGLDAATVATILEIKPDTVRQRLTRGRRLLEDNSSLLLAMARL